MAITKKIIISGLALILFTILTMGIFNFFKPKSNTGQFVSEGAFGENRNKQMQMTPRTLEQLRKLEVSSDKELKLEYFFYTNTAEKAKALADKLQELNYSVEHGQSAGEKSLFIVTGWTTKLKMSNQVVSSWTKEMCEIGYKYDCEFDGWGTDPTQE